MTTLCANHGQQLVAVFLLTALAFGTCVQPQLQQGTTHAAHNEPMPYPAAGYRPKIPFDLPRQPKLFFPTTQMMMMMTTTARTTTSMPTLMAPTEEIDINIETLDQTTTTSTSTTIIPLPRMPANNYGTPLENNMYNNNNSNNNITGMKVDLSVTEVINAPTEHLQPPNPNAAKNFNTAELDDIVGVDGVDVSVGDGDGDENLFSIEPQPKPKLNVFNRSFDREQHQIPASTYGVPNPDIGSHVRPSTPTDTGRHQNENDIDNQNQNDITLELELNESENELAKIFIPNSSSSRSNSNHLSASNEALNRLSALKTEHLIRLPADNAADILRQIYLANFANIKREH